MWWKIKKLMRKNKQPNHESQEVENAEADGNPQSVDKLTSKKPLFPKNRKFRQSLTSIFKDKGTD